MLASFLLQVVILLNHYFLFVNQPFHLVKGIFHKALSYFCLFWPPKELIFKRKEDNRNKELKICKAK